MQCTSKNIRKNSRSGKTDGDYKEMKKQIIRVYPYRTSYTPDDDMVYIGMPPMGALLPEHDEVHVSCIFTWDRAVCEELRYQWEGQTDQPVLLGGPAYDSPVCGFEPGLYVRRGIVFTTRGCNNACPWCCVPTREGKLVELPITEGNIIQDNNFLQASRQHKDRVFDMLRTQRSICFKGGLEPDLIDEHFISNITSLRIAELWLACDTDDAFPAFQKACTKLVKAGFNREKLKCYALSYGKDMDKDEARLQAIYAAGAMPFMQLYRELSEHKTTYSKDWNKFQRMWSRPAAIRAHMERGTHFQDFNT